MKPVGLDDSEPMLANVGYVLRGNLTPWWFLSTIYVIYFMATLGFPRIEYDTGGMAFHICMAFLFVVGCAWNLYHTPSHGPRFRISHRTVGWVTNVIGLASIISGYDYILAGHSKLSFSTKVLMMAIGAIQLLLQALGLWYVAGIRWVRGKIWTEQHAAMMTMLFYNSGTLIAINWLPKMITGNLFEGSAQTNWTFVSFLAGLTISSVAIKYNKRNMDLRDP